MKKVVTAVFMLVLSTGCFLPETLGNGTVKVDTRPFTGFTQVVNGSELKMTIVEGNSSGAVVTVDENLQALVTTNVVNGVLVVGNIGNITPTGNSVVAVTLPELKSASLTGSGAVEVSNLTQPRALALVDTGSGALTFSGQTLALEVQLSGSGSMNLSGSASGLDASVSGSGSLQAKAFTVNGVAKLASSGSGGITATVNGTVSFELSGSGSIDWYGTANVSGKDVSGSGRVNHR